SGAAHVAAAADEMGSPRRQEIGLNDRASRGCRVLGARAVASLAADRDLIAFTIAVIVEHAARIGDGTRADTARSDRLELEAGEMAAGAIVVERPMRRGEARRRSALSGGWAPNILRSNLPARGLAFDPPDASDPRLDETRWEDVIASRYGVVRVRARSVEAREEVRRPPTRATIGEHRVEPFRDQIAIGGFDRLEMAVRVDAEEHRPAVDARDSKPVPVSGAGVIVGVPVGEILERRVR